ncbi:hypothetical protein E8E01_01080 [Methylorubrum populi]|uniref:hypothetical protein n=1 Tax=Methylorubrum populi TaxID=223967 RepID=UPI0011529B32|nr:hypothetical protein [Methylorubrum populi]QDI79123.1 hypothetical protein E8E01_01080 [Methylorubrum populi]
MTETEFAVVEAARAWQDARMAAIQAPVETFVKDKKGDMIVVPNLQVWTDLGAAETALSVAVNAHRDTDLKLV